MHRPLATRELASLLFFLTQFFPSLVLFFPLIPAAFTSTSTHHRRILHLAVTSQPTASLVAPLLSAARSRRCPHLLVPSLPAASFSLRSGHHSRRLSPSSICYVVCRLRLVWRFGARSFGGSPAGICRLRLVRRFRALVNGGPPCGVCRLRYIQAKLWFIRSWMLVRVTRSWLAARYHL